MIPEARVAQPVTESEAARLAREIFSLDVSAKSLPGEYDDNFHLTSADGREFVLKVMHPAQGAILRRDAMPGAATFGQARAAAFASTRLRNTKRRRFHV